MRRAQAWIGDLEEKNPEYYSDRMGHFRKKVGTLSLNMGTLYGSSMSPHRTI